MSRTLTSSCAVLLLTLTFVSAAQRRLNSVNELKNYHRGERAGIIDLLHWFANIVRISNNVIHLPFDPQCDYGSHHYGNYEDLLESPRGCQYYTVGNIRVDTSTPLPLYVQNSQSGTNGWNTARIIFSADNYRQIHRVFITRHYGSSEDTSYDHEWTFEVSIDLLQELRRQQRLDGQQRDSFGNTLQFQEQSYQYIHQQCFTPQPNTRNNEMDCLRTLCVGALIIVCLFIFFSAITLSSNFHK